MQTPKNLALALLALSALSTACVKNEEGSDTAGVKRRPPPPKPSPTKGNGIPPYQACLDISNSFTTVDTWTLRYNSTWAANVLIQLKDEAEAGSLVFTHPTKALGHKQHVTDSECIQPGVDDTLIDQAYPVIAGVNLFNKSHPACPGSPKPADSEYRFVFVQKEKKYIAVSRGPDGCSPANQAKAGSCYLWGVVEGKRVTVVNNACLAGFNIYDRVGGVVNKAVCGTEQVVRVQGQPYPAGFILIHEPFPGWAKDYDCKVPGDPTPPTDPTPRKDATPPGGKVTPVASVTPATTPAPVPTATPAKGTTPEPKPTPTTPTAIPTVAPSAPPAPTQPAQKPPVEDNPFTWKKGNAIPTPPPGATPYAPPMPPCDPWKEGSCRDGWSKTPDGKGGMPAPAPTQQQGKTAPTDPVVVPVIEEKAPSWTK